MKNNNLALITTLVAIASVSLYAQQGRNCYTDQTSYLQPSSIHTLSITAQKLTANNIQIMTHCDNKTTGYIRSQYRSLGSFVVSNTGAPEGYVALGGFGPQESNYTLYVMPQTLTLITQILSGEQ